MGSPALDFRKEGKNMTQPNRQTSDFRKQQSRTLNMTKQTDFRKEQMANMTQANNLHVFI